MKSVISALIPILTMSAAQASEAYVLPAAIPEIREDSPAKEAWERFRNGGRSASVEMARPLADQGNAEALFLLAFAMESKLPAKLSRGQAMDHYYGKAADAGNAEARLRRNLILLASGMEKERNDGRQALEAAAKQDPLACRILGEAWLRGFITGKPDAVKAEECWKKAVEKGDKPSLLLLARLHDGTFDVTEMKDAKSAIGFYRSAAEGGEEEAMVPLGSLLLKNNGSPANMKEGHVWLRKAAEKNFHESWLVLGDHEKTVEKNEKLALEYYHKGAEAGDPTCMIRIGDTCGDSERKMWLLKAEDAGSPEAAADLGELFLKDKQPDYDAAGIHLLAAAREGVARAQYHLGLLYLDRTDGEADPVAAFAWLTEAMKSGDAEAQFKLGNLNEQGIGCPINYANAGVLYTLACDKGHAAAATRIARMALEGLGTTRSLAQAKAHAQLGLERGDQSANWILRELDGKLDEAESAKAEKALADLRAGVKKIRPQAGAAGASQVGK